MVRNLSDDIAADAAATFLDTRHFATTVIQYPLGDTSAGVSRTALVDLTAQDGVLRIEEEGSRIVQRGLLYLDASIAVDDRDTWLIDSELWAARGVTGADDGLQVVEIQRAVQKSQRGHYLRGS